MDVILFRTGDSSMSRRGANHWIRTPLLVIGTACASFITLMYGVLRFAPKEGSYVVAPVLGALASGVVVAGLLGARIWLAHWRSRGILVARYHCAGTRNTGDNGETPGEMHHNRGHQVDRSKLPMRIRSRLRRLPVWEWSPVVCGRMQQDGSPGSATICGPYTRDISREGSYRVVFRIACVGPKEWWKNDAWRVLLELDVAFQERTSADDTEPPQNRSARRFLTAIELGTLSGWHDESLDFEFKGHGLVEYRIIVPEKEGQDLSAMNRQLESDKQVRLFFDTITVYRLVPEWEINP